MAVHLLRSASTLHEDQCEKITLNHFQRKCVEHAEFDLVGTIQVLFHYVLKIQNKCFVVQ